MHNTQSPPACLSAKQAKPLPLEEFAPATPTAAQVAAADAFFLPKKPPRRKKPFVQEKSCITACTAVPVD